MPRLIAGAPGLAASPDTRHIAVARAGRVALVSADSRKESSSAELPAGDETDVAFTPSGRLLAATRQPNATVISAFTVPALEPITRLELPGALKLMTAIGERLFLTTATGELPRIVNLTNRALGADPIGVREPVQLAVAAPEDRLLVAARDQLEAWDPLRRRALFRINLPLSSPRFAGFAGRRRLLWVGSSTRLGEFSVFRFSDGRLVSRTELGRRILGVDGHPESPRLVLAARADENRPLELFQFDLSIDERLSIPFDGTLGSFAMADGARPVLVAADSDGALEFVTLPRATPLEEGLRESGSAMKSAIAAAKRRLTPTRPVTDGPPSWRNRLGQPGAAPAGAAPSRPADANAESPPDDEAGGDEPARAVDWRAGLVRWGEALLGATAGGASLPSPPVHPESPLADAIGRLGLDGTAADALQLLYAAWLLGRAPLPAATVARALDAERAGAWAEALGRGGLGRAGLVRARRGQLELRVVAGRFLDGAEPSLDVFLPAGEERAPTLVGAHRVEPGEAPEPLAQAVANHLGCAVALVEMRPGRPTRRLPGGLVAARLHGWVPLVVLDGSDDGRWLAELGDELTLVASRGELAGAPSLPTLTL
jgi:hypothetical protein